MTSSGGLHCAVAKDGLALLDTRRGRGRWRILDPISADLWTRITSGTPAQNAVEELVRHWSGLGVDPARVRSDLTAVAGQLGRERLLFPAEHAAPRPSLPAVRFATAATAPFRVRLAAHAALPLALVLLRCAPLRFTLSVARTVTRLPGRAATVGEAEAVHAAVRRAGRAWPGRSACLEESLATFLAAALTGRRTRWVLGAAFLPQGAHAWIEAGDSIIGQAREDRVWPYVAALEVERSN